jgi:AbrB family looped-hinge helix DNA binding protein
MDSLKPLIAEINSRGQLTIPKKIRESLHLEAGQTVSVISTGNAVIITPRSLELDDARRQLRRIIKESGCTLEELLAGLTEERQILFDEQYGTKDN